MSRRSGARRPLGAAFFRLFAASAVANVNDGIRLAAGPLLVASLTDDPALVGGAVFVQQLPWLLVSLPAGAYIDRLDRLRLVRTVGLFAAGAALPFGIEAVGLVLTAALLAGIRTPPAPEPDQPRERGWLRWDIAEGVRWLWHHPAARLLAVVLCVMNVTFMAAFAVWVLYATQRLGLSEAQFGLLLTASAVGGLIGTAVTGRLTDRFGMTTLLRAGLLIETGVHVVLALTRSPWVAGGVMLLFGAYAALWGIVVATVRQRVVPTRLLGRVSSVYFLLTMGGASLGALGGGFLARSWGLTAPFWLAAADNSVLILLVWRRFTDQVQQPPDEATGTFLAGRIDQ